MDLEIFRDYCLSKKGVTEGLPFGPDVLVYKVMGKMFALTSLNEEFFRISLKNLPEINQELRAEYSSVLPGYHMSKQHWNTIHIDGSIKSSLIKEWIDQSYDIILKSLPKKIQEEFNSL